jgi:hypothetical protein
MTLRRCRPIIALLSCLCAASLVQAGDPGRVTLGYAPAPADNPLKGLVPYAGDRRDGFPHSMEFNYLPLAALVTGYDAYDWKSLEELLDGIAGRGHQAVFRVYLSISPGRSSTGSSPATRS